MSNLKERLLSEEKNNNSLILNLENKKDQEELELLGSRKLKSEVEDDNNNKLGLESISDVLKNCWIVILNMFFCNILRTLCLSGLSDRSTMIQSSNDNYIK